MSGALPSITVVMPLFNKRPHVAAAIDSVFGQSSPCTELIIVDDGSSDGSREYVRGLSDPRLRLFERSEPGPGGYAARNLAIREARSDWIAFLDADDIWTADHLAGVRDSLATAPADIGCVFTRYAYVAGQRSWLKDVSARLAQTPGAPIDFADFLHAWLDVGDCPIWTGAVAFRKSVLVEAGLFPEGPARRGGDKDLWLRAMSLTKAVFNPAVSAKFTQDSVNKVTKTVAFERPCLVQTAQAMLPEQSPTIRRLLRRLVNQELRLYAKWSVRQDRISPALMRSVMWPEGLWSFLFIAMIAMAPAPLRRSAVAQVSRLRRRAA